MLAKLGLVLVLCVAAIPEAVLPLHPYLARQETLDAVIDGISGTFLFDTGEGVTAISPQFAEKIGCRPWGRITGFRMTGEELGNRHCDNLTFDAGATRLAVPSAVTIDIMALMGGDVPHIDGAIGLDAFAGRVVTIVPRMCVIVETEESLRARVAMARLIPIRLVRDAEGVALSVDAAVPTPDGTAWMELDTGSGGSTVVANDIAPLLGMPIGLSNPTEYDFALANGIVVKTPVRTRPLIIDGDIGARFLNDWILTLDLAKSRAWLTPYSSSGSACSM